MRIHKALALIVALGMSVSYATPVQHLYKVWEVLPINICQYTKWLACMHEQQSCSFSSASIGVQQRFKQ